MNEKFFSLPEAKQQAIINAGYRVFSQNSYKNSPMSEIAEAAGISKALLFHYFHNKKELYLFLWDKCAETTIETMSRYDCYGQTRLNLDPAQFVPGVDVAMMYREMYWASEGYLWEKVQQGGAMDIDQMEKDFMELLKFWKNVYLRKE